MVANWDSIDKAEAVFQQMVALVKETAGLRIDEAERSLFDMALRTCGHMLQAFIDKAGDGDLGETVQREGKTLRRSTDRKARVYRSISGVLTVDRYVYAAAAKKAAWTPVDAELGLPAGEQSYVLEDWMQRMCLKESFREGTGSLRDLLGVNTSVRAAERMNRHMAEYVASFQESQPPPDEETEEEILVLAADGKGVPMRRPLEARLQEHKAKQQETEQQEPEQPGTQPQETGADAGSQAATQENTKKKTKKKRLGRGEKQTRKQMAYVAAVYSIAAFTRTAGQVVDDLRRQQRQADRPRPQHKQVFAEMTRFREGEVLNGQQRCFARLAWSAIRRAAGRTIVCLMDGQRSLWNLKESWFPRAVGILDIFHVMERLWQIAHAFHGDGSAEAEQQVSRHLRLLLEGKSQLSDRRLSTRNHTAETDRRPRRHRHRKHRILPQQQTVYEIRRISRGGLSDRDRGGGRSVPPLRQRPHGDGRDALGDRRRPGDALPPRAVPERPVGHLHRTPHSN